MSFFLIFRHELQQVLKNCSVAYLSNVLHVLGEGLLKKTDTIPRGNEGKTETVT